MNTAHNSGPDFTWDEIPAFRRHIYFFLLLLLGTIVADSLLGTVESKGRLAFSPAPPPRITSAEVYPAPVQGLSPKPSESAQ